MFCIIIIILFLKKIVLCFEKVNGILHILKKRVFGFENRKMFSKPLANKALLGFHIDVLLIVNVFEIIVRGILLLLFYLERRIRRFRCKND